MVRVLASIIIVLHGLVHIWFLLLTRGFVPPSASRGGQPALGWSGRSWLFTDLVGDSATRALASVILLLATAGFSIGGIAFLTHQQWSRPLLITSATVSAVFFLLFWDGSLQFAIQKGLVGFLIDAAILAGLLLSR